MKKLSVTNLPVENKKVLIRVDFNVPIKDGKILDDTRIKAALPTIEHILKRHGRLVIMSHLGRPKGEGFEEKYSLKLVSQALSRLLGFEVPLVKDCIGDEVQSVVNNLEPGRAVLLENLRFYKGEEKPKEDPSFAQGLISLGDVYVNDAFGTSHRKHASVYVVPQSFLGRAAVGFLLEKELEFIGEHLLINPKKPFAAVLGGSKVTSKIGVLDALVTKVDMLLLGGGMGFTFLKAMGKQIGNSLFEEDGIELAKKIMNKAEALGVQIILPKDVKAAKECSSSAEVKVFSTEDGIPNEYEGLDIGPDTEKLFCDALKHSSTVFWNGPVGVYEVKPFDRGSIAIAKCLSELSSSINVVGGGDAGAVVSLANVDTTNIYVSTGGGASLEFIEKGILPGIEVLS